jgi:hypothetical protein
MASQYRILGQVNPSASAASPVFIATAQSVVSTVAVCNTASAAAKYRLAARPASASVTSTEHYLVFDGDVDGNDSVFLTLGVTLGVGDRLEGFVSASTVAFSAFGSEVS